MWCRTDQVQVGSLGQQLDVGTATLDARLETDFVPSIRDRRSDEDRRHSEKLEEAHPLLDDERFGVEDEWPQQKGRDGVMFGSRLEDKTFISGQLTVLHLFYCPFTCPQNTRPSPLRHRGPEDHGGCVLTVVLGDVFVRILLLGAGHHPAEEDRTVTDKNR